MAMKSFAFSALLVVVLMASHTEAQQEPNIRNLIRIIGNLFCSLNGKIVPNAIPPTLPFANATIQLLCDEVHLISSTETNSLGKYSLIITEAQRAVSTLVQSCKLVVITPLSSCNSSLPANGLKYALQAQGDPVDINIEVTTLILGTDL